MKKSILLASIMISLFTATIKPEDKTEEKNNFSLLRLHLVQQLFSDVGTTIASNITSNLGGYLRGAVSINMFEESYSLSPTYIFDRSLYAILLSICINPLAFAELNKKIHSLVKEKITDEKASQYIAIPLTITARISSAIIAACGWNFLMRAALNTNFYMKNAIANVLKECKR